MLKIANATMRFGGVTAVNGVNINVHDGQIVGLIGPNGAGKTTVFNMITGVYKPTEGAITYAREGKEVDITGMRPDRITDKGICRTFQNIRLFKSMSVFDNVFIGNHMNLKSNLLSAVVRLPSYVKEEAAIVEQTDYLLDIVGLADVKNETASSLPYGKQRRLEIARALATKPELLLLDEPAAGMNPQETQELMVFIRKIKERFDLSILLIEHHMELVMNICDHIYVLDHGVLIAEGDAKAIQGDEKVIQAYLGVE